MGYARRTVDVTSSLPFQILIHYNWWVIFAYVIVSIATFIYKGTLFENGASCLSHDARHLYISHMWLLYYTGTQFPYPTYLIGWEGSALALLMIIDIARLAIATKGNKSRNIPNMVRHPSSSDTFTHTAPSSRSAIPPSSLTCALSCLFRSLCWCYLQSC